MEEVKVIFHIDELDKWVLLLKNVENKNVRLTI